MMRCSVRLKINKASSRKAENDFAQVLFSISQKGWGIWFAIFSILTLASIPNIASSQAGGDIREITSEAVLPKIISLAPHITESLYAVGAGEQIVGTVSYSDYPPAALDIPRIGGHDKMNYEAILALAPDLIIAWKSGNGRETIDRLKALGFNVYEHDPRSFEDVAESLIIFGELSGHRDKGLIVAENFTQRIEALRREYSLSKRDPVAVFYQLWDEPYITINGQHLISDVIELCGGRNIFADALPIAPKIGIESIISRQPDVIVTSVAEEQYSNFVKKWQRWPSVPAVKNHRLERIPGDLLQRQGPRIADGAEQMCRILANQPPS